MAAAQPVQAAPARATHARADPVLPRLRPPPGMVGRDMWLRPFEQALRQSREVRAIMEDGR